MSEIVETDEFGNPTIIRVRIRITNNLTNNIFVQKYVGQEAWLYERDLEQWVMTEDNFKLILLPYISSQKPGEYIYI